MKHGKRDFVPGTVALAYIHPADVSSFWADSMLSLVEYETKVLGHPPERISLLSGPRIASARNQVVAEFLNHRRSEWLLFTDVDMAFAPNAVRTLLAAAEQVDAKIMGALCYAMTPTEVTHPTIFRLKEDEGGKRFERWDNPPPKNSVVKCDATGTGFIIIHQDVLVDIAEKWHGRTAYVWFADTELPYDGDMVEAGEDVTFCVRASVVGHQTWICTAVDVNHAKMVLVTPKHFRRYLREEKAGLTHEQRILDAMPYSRDIEDPKPNPPREI